MKILLGIILIFVIIFIFYKYTKTETYQELFEDVSYNTYIDEIKNESNPFIKQQLIEAFKQKIENNKYLPEDISNYWLDKINKIK